MYENEYLYMFKKRKIRKLFFLSLFLSISIFI